MSLTVFILGAGASKEAGGPLMADFLDTADELRKTIDLGDDKASFDAVFKGISALQAVHSKSTLDVYNLESVFAAFEMASLFGRLGSLTAEEIRGMSSAIRRLIVRTLEERIMLPVRGKTVIPPSPYEEFVRLVLGLPRSPQTAGPANASIVTFNYDLSLDFAFYYRRLAVDYCLKLSSDKIRFHLMKLHGSLNWARCSECNAVVPWHLDDFFSKRNWNIWVTEPKSVHLNVSSLLKEIIHCDKHVASDPVIVPPTWNKTQYHQEIGAVWSHAAKHLSEAENVFVIGYSLPDTDQFFRYLYSLGTVGDTLLKRFWVFDPNRALVQKRFEALLGETAKARFRFVEAKFSDAVAMLHDHFKVKDD